MPAPIYRLPPYHVEALLTASEVAQKVDWGLLLYGVPDAWKHTRGAGATVAVLDTGIDAEHPDLEGQLIVNNRRAPMDFTGSAFGWGDRVGHGTHVAGIIAARDNDRGVVGVAPEAKLLIGKVLGDDGSGQGDWVAKGIVWAVEKKADVISLSLGSSRPDIRIQAAIQYATTGGVFVVCAAGNSGTGDETDEDKQQIDYPARWPVVLAVAATRNDGKLSDFSSRGPEVDFAAPGEQILSTWKEGKYARLSGTSMATPFVAGVVALLVSRHRLPGVHNTPLVTLADLHEHLARHAIDAGPAGDDIGFGRGIVHVGRLLEAERAAEPPATLPSPDGPGEEIEFLGVTIHTPPRLTDRWSVNY